MLIGRMRFIFPLAAALFVAGCMARDPETPQPQPRPPVAESPPARSNLVGMSAGELIQRLGPPDIQVREGPGLKLQFRGLSCILDAYLYPTPQGGLPERVMHVDTRMRNGNDIAQDACIASLARS